MRKKTNFTIILFQQNFEKLVFKRLKSFIDEKKIISSSQYSFRQGHSTEHAILILFMPSNHLEEI